MSVGPRHPDPSRLRGLSLAIFASTLAIIGAVALPCIAVARDERPGDTARPVDFAAQIRPVFARACSKCHGPEKQRGGLRLDARASPLKGGDSGEPAIVPFDPGASVLLERVASADPDRRMPPKGERLPASELALLKRWVAEGADWPATETNAKAGRAAMIVTAADREHWSFRPLQPVRPPQRPPGSLGPHGDRPIHHRRPGSQEPQAGACGRSPYVDPPRDLRPRRFAADARGGRGVRQ